MILFANTGQGGTLIPVSPRGPGNCSTRHAALAPNCELYAPASPEGPSGPIVESLAPK